MMKNITFYTILFAFHFTMVDAQSTYPASAYAIIGDTLYLTGATFGNADFSVTGASSTWDYSALTGVSQQRLVFRNPKQTGFTAAQWPFIQNTSNTNLSSSNGQSIAIGTIQTVNPNDYFKTTTSILQQSASSYDVYVGSKKISVKNTYSSPDVIYSFPLAYGNLTDSSTAQYATNIPNVYYNSSVIKRKNVIDGWGTIKTPYGTFTNALRVVSTVDQSDSIAVNGTGIPTIYSTYRDIKWLDASKKYPVLIVHQNKVGSQFITSSVSYLDVEQFYQPTALFAFYPTSPMPNDTLHFQNLSINSLTYVWDFGDPASGSANNSSSVVNPQHIYTTAGKYKIKLKVYNGPLLDSITLPVQVGITPTADFTYSPTSPSTTDVVSFQNQSSNADSYTWDFGDPSSGSNNSSTISDPQHNFATANDYQVVLVAYNGSLTDTLKTMVSVSAVVTGLTSQNNTQQLVLYPNPSDQYVSVSSDEEYVHVSITDLSGNTLLENEVAGNKIDLSVLPKGCYILYLKNASGKQAQAKVIKK